jgi:ribonuclease-3
MEAMTGPDHDRTFHVTVHVDNRKVAAGTGRSKKEAQQNAAAEALALLREKHNGQE